MAVVDFLERQEPDLPVTVKTYDAFHSWIGTAPRSYQPNRKSFANSPYVMIQVDDDGIHNALLFIDGELSSIDGRDIGAVYRQCRTDGATIEGDRSATRASLADLTQFLREVFSP